MAVQDTAKFDKRLYGLRPDGVDVEGYALMGLLGINVLGMSYRRPLEAENDPEGHNISVYNVEYQMENGKWAKFLFETISDHEQVPMQIVNEVKLLRGLQKEYLKELGQ